MNRYGFKLIELITDYWYVVFASTAGAFALAPLFGVVAAHLGYLDIYKIVFTFYSSYCHQLPERSLFLGGLQYPVDFRDMVLYFSTFTAILIWPLIKEKRMPFWAFICLLMPMALDGGTQLAGLRNSSNFLRVITGFLAGGASIYLLPYLAGFFNYISRQINEL